MARRSSARLRDKNSSTSTPKRVSLSHDVPDSIRTPQTVPARLASLQEIDEVPGTFPHSASPKSAFALNPTAAKLATPSKDTPIKPSDREMHPQLHHQTTAKPREEARHLGFSIMAPHTEPTKHTSRIAALQSTPSKAWDRSNDFKSANYQFTFHREHSLELSPEAKKLMYEKREEAAKIREQMIADGAGFPSIDEVLARKIAKPKGRFSQVHLKEFEKMDSIAGHHSTFRLKPSSSSEREAKQVATTTKSLKRSPSKTELDQSNSTPPGSSTFGAARLSSAVPSSHLPRSTSIKGREKPSSPDHSSSAKRVKRNETDDASTTRPISNDEKPLPPTPGVKTQAHGHASSSNLAHLTTPTKASLARASSVKSVKTSKIPAPSITPVKPPAVLSQKPPVRADEHNASPALLSRSPSKAALFPQIQVPRAGKLDSKTDTLLSRSPSKPVISRRHATVGEDEAAPTVKTSPLLARSPLKAPVPKQTQNNETETKATTIPFLARSPAKFPITRETEDAQTPSTTNKLLGRFNLLRQSPMKSILRSPQRLYSEDPAKVAAGTHMATPPKYAAKPSAALSSVPSTAFNSTKKHVDFSSSTKARYERIQSSTPSKTPTPSPDPGRTTAPAADTDPVIYPDLSAHSAMLSPSPQKRRQTSGPLDFTFRAGDQEIIFNRSPNSRPTSTKNSRPSTIRVVSSNPAAPVEVTGSKKRKFEFENKAAVASEDVSAISDKENTPAVATKDDDTETEQRPAKRVKQSAPGSQKMTKPAATAAIAPKAAHRTTMGVKPKGAKPASPVKRPNTISRARLDTLSQPKRRG